jgi:hypothetical protein
VRAAFLQGLSDYGDVEGVYRQAISTLRRSRDPELRVLARILSRKVRTGVTVKFVEGRGRRSRASIPIATSEGQMSRREVGRLVFDFLGKPETGEKIARSRLKGAVYAVVARLSVKDTVVKRCFHEHRVSLAAEASFPKLANRTAK